MNAKITTTEKAVTLTTETGLAFTVKNTKNFIENLDAEMKAQKIFRTDRYRVVDGTFATTVEAA